MPVYIRKSPTEIPDPSEAGGSDDDKDLFLRDPEQFQDRLPQPYRMIEKVLNRLVDRAWGVISEREASRIVKGSRKETSTLDPTAEVKLEKKPNCMSCTRDGKYVFLGHNWGLSVISTSSLNCVAAWEDESLEITSLHSGCLGDVTYLLLTVDDMGVSRIFAFCPDFLCLIQTINETDDVSQREVFTKFELSQDGTYAAAVIECNGEFWLEVYLFPVEIWLKELDAMHAASQNLVPQGPGGGEIKFSHIGLIMRIRPPRTLSGTNLKSPFEVLQRTENGNVIGSGTHHMISGHQWENQQAVFKSVYGNVLCENKCKAKEAEDSRSLCTFHFLFPGGLTPYLSEGETQSGMPIAISLWWRGSHNLLQYILSKPEKDNPDMEPQPNGVWPNANHIICSATSRCTRYISIGLMDGTVTIWDRCLGIPWSVVTISDDSIISGMRFLHQPTGPYDTPMREDPFQPPSVCVLVTCKSGKHCLIMSRKGSDSQVTNINERATDHVTLPSTVWSCHVQQKLILFMYRNGDITLRDIHNGTEECNLALPPTHSIAPLWSPVCELDSTRQTLFVRGDKNTSQSEDDSSLFLFHLPESPVTEQHCRSLSGAGGAERESRDCISLEKTFNRYLQERCVSLKERNKVMAESWSRLPELARGHRVHSAPRNQQGKQKASEGH